MLSTTTVCRICFRDCLDQFVLTGGEIHGLYVESLGLKLVVAADDNDGGVGFRSDVGGLFQIGRACFWSVMACGVFRHSMPTPRAEVTSMVAAGAFPDAFGSVEESGTRAWPHHRTASATGAGHDRVRSDHGDRMHLRRIEP